MKKVIEVPLADELATKYERLSQHEKDRLTAVIESLLKEGIPTSKYASSAQRTDKLPTFDLGGKFDQLDIRKAAYE